MARLAKTKRGSTESSEPNGGSRRFPRRPLSELRLVIHEFLDQLLEDSVMRVSEPDQRKKKSSRVSAKTSTQAVPGRHSNRTRHPD